MSASALLRLDGAAVRFGRVAALAPLTLALHPGERVAVVGSNGSGKTTLLRLLHGVLACSEGRREVLAASAPRMAMLYQRPFLLSLSVQANVRLALWLAGVPRAQRAARCASALQRVGLAELAARPARALSVGQQQRLALARAWAVAPQLLLLDEPTASLDPHAKREVEQLMASFADEGLTLVWSTHNLGQVKRLATRVLYLQAGQLLVDATAADFFSAAAPPAAAQFLKGELPW